MDGRYGDSTRTVKAVGLEAVPGAPVAPPPVPAAAYHIPPNEDDALDSYGRYHNPTWRQLESALAQLEGAAAALTFGSGMAAITSTLRALTKPDTTLVVPADGYYQVRRYATEYLAHTVMRYLIAAKIASLGGKAFFTLVSMQWVVLGEWSLVLGQTCPFRCLSGDGEQPLDRMETLREESSEPI